ncbi:MAG: CotH kinase family protein [Acidobacteria bacterium]|nr:CotH kinase family protein [Acidobacteriota bacterium]
MLRFTRVLAALAVFAVFGLGAGLSNEAAAQVQDWPLVFDPTVVHHLNLSTMAPADTTCVGPEDPAAWTAIQQDATFTVETPALFWPDSEAGSKLCVSLRRKSADPLGPPLDPKVSLKIDFNQLLPGQRWHLLRKLSLENGDDVNTAAEGAAWQLQQLAANATTAPADMTPGLASWVTVAVNGTEYGIYVNVEQRDKSFLQNRGIFDSSATWIYKVGDFHELVTSPLGVDSPTQTNLCYSPFEPVTCSTPDDATLASDLNSQIDMDVMLAQGDVETFLAAKDGLSSKGRNGNELHR